MNIVLRCIIPPVLTGLRSPDATGVSMCLRRRRRNRQQELPPRSSFPGRQCGNRAHLCHRDAEPAERQHVHSGALASGSGLRSSGRLHGAGAGSNGLGERGRRRDPGQELMRIEGVEVGEIKARFITARAQLQIRLKQPSSGRRRCAEQRVGSRKSLLEAQAEL